MCCPKSSVFATGSRSCAKAKWSSCQACGKAAAWLRGARAFTSAKNVITPPELPPGLELTEQTPRLWRLTVAGPIGPLLARLQGLPVKDMELEEARLEDVVLKILPQGGLMRGPFLLFRLSLKRVRLLLCATGLLLAAVQVLRVRIAASVHNAGQFDLVAALLPSSVRAILGPSLSSIMTFNGIVCGVYFDTGYIIALLALVIALATLPASEIETGFADLILARPLPRHWLITRTIALVLLSILLMLLMIMAGTWAGLGVVRSPGRPVAVGAPDRLDWP